MTDARALRQLQNGSQESLAWLIDRYSPYVAAIIRNILGGVLDGADMEEAAADVFIALWRNAPRVQPVNLKAYLGSIARNEAKKRLRAMGRELPLDEDLLILDPDSPEARLEERELREAVRQAVLAMDWPDREIFLRHYYYCQGVEQLARDMGMNTSTVKSRLRRGREKLKSALKPYLSEEGGAGNAIQNF